MIGVCAPFGEMKSILMALFCESQRKLPKWCTYSTDRTISETEKRILNHTSIIQHPIMQCRIRNKQVQ